MKNIVTITFLSLVALILCGTAVAAEIHRAARTGDLESVKEILSRDPASINAREDDGRTPLHWAVRGVHVEVVEYLLEHGADVNIRDANQVIPLHSLAYRGEDELAARMIAGGADIDARAVNGSTPLHFAVQAGHTGTVDLLLSHGASPEPADEFGNSPLLLACSYGLRETVELLVVRGINLEQTNRRGDTPLTVAQREGHTGIVKLLLDKGADPTRIKERSVPEGPYLGQKTPGKTPVIFAPRIVSTERSQLNAVFSPDGKEFYFTQRTPRGSSIMAMRMEDSRWSRPSPVSFSGRHADVDLFVTHDGLRMYFCSNRSRTSSGDPAPDVDIWVSTRTGDTWGEPRHLGPTVNSEGDDYYPTLADDGTLYFSSNREGGLGENDVYAAVFADGGYAAPANLGEAVNTRYREFDPFVSQDHGYLIFASERPGGYGSSDLYISFRLPDGSWSQARNMGPGINSDSADFTPMLTPDGRFLFLTSDRGGVSDLYWVDARVIDDLRKENGPRSGPYFGQEPPGMEPREFTPELLSRTKPQWAFCAEFSPDHREFYYSEEDPELQLDRIMWMRRIGDNWTAPEPAPFNSPHCSNDSRISPDGRRLYFRSRRPLPGRTRSDSRLRLWSVARSEDSWGEIEPVLFDGEPGITSHAGVAANGTLYFSYRSADGTGNVDVHRSPLSDGARTKPENLGPGINTVYTEGDVYVSPDESLLIVSVWDHPDNNGDSDLYISFRKPDGSWSPLKNLGHPVNTGANENCAAFSPDGRYFFYAAVRIDGDKPTIATYWVDARILDAHRPTQ